ncbi:MAG: T9SS type A sorting domain-containing protein [Chitinophagaceae bacterium]|nr:T9SS type A sorting domain-containing protein [Chitinophagaceae bacterium]
MPNNTIGRISTLLSSVETDSSTTLLDGALMLYGNNFSDSLDLEDAKKLFNNTENFGLSKGSAVYQIEKRQNINETDTIQYNIRGMKQKNYQLAVDVQNIDQAMTTAYLKDKFTNIETTLNSNSTTVYPFSITADAASKAADRFMIYFRQVSVLPVTFTSLNAYRKNKTVNVEWKVENEINIGSYEVERSTDGIRFSKQHSLTNVTNNNSSNTYQWTDVQPQVGLNYFRIKSMDNDGRWKYSNVAKVFFGKEASAITVFPNPVSEGKINVFFTEQQPGDYTARLFNNTGQLMKSVKLQQIGSNGNAVINLDNGIIHGNYILEIIKPDNTTEHINIVY